MGLQDLCPEILFQICELFCEHCQEEWYGSGPPPEWWRFDHPRSTLLALSLVCKSVRSIAQRVLHHHFGYANDHDDCIAQFCRTISNKPELAKDLRWADLSSFRKDGAPEDVVQGWLPKTINQFSRHLLDGGQEISHRALLTAVILLQAPNLERLDDEGRDYKAAFDLLNHDAVIRDRALPPNLKYLRLGDPVNAFDVYDMTMMDLSWNGLGGFINTFKELISLVIYCPLASGVDERLSFQSILVLHLHEFHMPRKDLENLISRMPHLETFAISRLDTYIEGMPDPASVPDILQVLVQRNDTLRRLELDMSCIHDDVKLLKALTNLEELEMILGASEVSAYRRRRRISKQAFVDIMPPALQTLHIHVYGKETFEKASDALTTYISSTY